MTQFWTNLWKRIVVLGFGWTVPKIRRFSYQKWQRWHTHHLISERRWASYHFVYMQINDHPHPPPGSRLIPKPEWRVWVRDWPKNTKILLLNYALDVMDVARELLTMGFRVYVNRDRERHA